MSMLQLLGGVAVAGAVAAGTTAMTGSGVVWGGTGGGTPTQFVGGTLTQSVVGASIDNIVYVNDATGTHTTSIAVTISGADQQYLKLTPAGGGFSGAAEWECSGDIVAPLVGATPKVQINKASGAVVTCVTGTSGTPGGYYSALTGLALAVTTS